MTFGTLSDGWGWDDRVQINVVGNFKAMELDFKLDPTTAPTKNGNFGTLEIGLVYKSGTAWNPIKLGEIKATTANTSWTHFSFPIDVTASGLDTVLATYVKIWSDGAYTQHSGVQYRQRLPGTGDQRAAAAAAHAGPRKRRSLGRSGDYGRQQLPVAA